MYNLHFLLAVRFLCYQIAMPRPKKQQTNVQVAAAASRETEKLIEQLAEQLDWSKAKVAGRLLALGVSSFLKDGHLDDVISVNQQLVLKLEEQVYLDK